MHKSFVEFTTELEKVLALKKTDPQAYKKLFSMYLNETEPAGTVFKDFSKPNVG